MYHFYHSMYVCINSSCMYVLCMYIGITYFTVTKCMYVLILHLNLYIYTFMCVCMCVVFEIARAMYIDVQLSKTQDKRVRENVRRDTVFCFPP